MNSIRKTIMICTFFGILTACSNEQSKDSGTSKTSDSIENAEIKQVDQLLKNDDSLIKAKEKELLEQYK